MKSAKKKNLLGACKQAGFTLLELLVVLAILALLAGLVGPRVMKQFDATKGKTARLQLEKLSASLDMLKLDVGRYPNSEEGLEALVSNQGDMNGWNGPYLRKSKVPKDPWGTAYHYKYPGDHGSFDLYSLGADNSEGGEEDKKDVVSWE